MSISACMIVRDEEKLLRQCLDSIKDLYGIQYLDEDKAVLLRVEDIMPKSVSTEWSIT